MPYVSTTQQNREPKTRSPAQTVDEHAMEAEGSRVRVACACLWQLDGEGEKL